MITWWVSSQWRESRGPIHCLSGACYEDRLLVAHFAIITFGLVALFGAWHDPVAELWVAFGLWALLALVCLGCVRVFGRCPVHRPASRVLFTLHLRACGCARAMRVLLEFIRKANLLCGAPPCLPFVARNPWDGGSMWPSALNPHPFLIP